LEKTAGKRDEIDRAGNRKEPAMKIQRTVPPAAAPIDAKSLAAGLAGIFASQRYFDALACELREYFGVKHVFLVSSGKAALVLILQALHSLAPEKRTVTIPAYTCFSVPSAIVKSGLDISLCDVGKDSFDYDHGLLSEAVGRDTLCVVASHLFGIPADMNKIRKLSDERNVFIVEDAAQAMGGKHNGKLLGTIGDAGFFSLGRGKNVTCGSGGIIITDDDRIAAAVEKRYSVLAAPRLGETIADYLKALLLTVFIRPSLYWLPAGLPFLKLGKTLYDPMFSMKKLSGMQAGLLKQWRRRLDESNRVREENVKFFCDGPGQHQEQTRPLLRMPAIWRSREERDRIYGESCRQGLGISLMYPSGINEIREIRDRFNGRTYRSAQEIAGRLAAVPTHQLLSVADKKQIRQLIRNQVTLPGYSRVAALGE
jgi:perosamine synthetase